MKTKMLSDYKRKHTKISKIMKMYENGWEAVIKDGNIIMYKEKKDVWFWNTRNIIKKRKKILIELICNEQTHMIIKDHSKYESTKYKNLEKLKVKIKDM